MDNFKIIEGKKYMWDGEVYETESDACENLRDGWFRMVKLVNIRYQT